VFQKDDEKGWMGWSYNKPRSMKEATVFEKERVITRE